jgi:glycosyltransferase involved in cell wall biosynthesis
MSASRRKLAVGLAVYNGQQYLARAIDSILSQTFGDFELILSDNASTDGTEEICRTYARNDRRVRYLRNAVNVGVAENFNIAFRASNSRYFRWAAHDDVIGPSYLQQCLKLLDADPAMAAAHSLTRAIDENDTVFRVDPEPVLLQSPSAAERYRAIITGREHAFWSVIRSDFIRQAYPHKPHPSSEFIFQAEIALRGRFGIVKEPLFGERWHAGRYSQNNRSKDQMRQWWGQGSSHSVLLQAPIRFYGQADAVWRSPLQWEQKVLCWRHLSGCMRDYVSSIAQRNRRRLWTKTDALLQRLGRPSAATQHPKDQYDASLQ